MVVQLDDEVRLAAVVRTILGQSCVYQSSG
jgi:hypothetical protein